MGHRQSILSSQGYEVRYEQRPKERGSPSSKHCVAIKGGSKYFAFTICQPDHPDHYRRIQSVQDSIPHMARMVGPIEDVVLLEEVSGEKLWEMDDAPDYALVVERQLIEFAAGTKENRLIHGDLRPWNVFFDKRDNRVQVIDWWSVSSFVEDLVGHPPRRLDLIEEDKHYAKFHPNLVAQGDFTNIDLTDARRLGKLLKCEIGRLTEAWPQQDSRSWYPPWCKH